VLNSALIVSSPGDLLFFNVITVEPLITDTLINEHLQ
jgi:hypothetical protein